MAPPKCSGSKEKTHEMNRVTIAVKVLGPYKDSCLFWVFTSVILPVFDSNLANRQGLTNGIFLPKERENKSDRFVIAPMSRSGDP